MTPKGDALQESTSVIREIESNLEENLRRRREEIERDLEERLRREREESDRKLSQIEAEFHKEKGALREYHGAVAEYEAARDSLEAELKGHLDRSAGFQKEIERLTSLTVEELHVVTDLSARLADLRLSSEEKINQIRIQLRERFGVDPKSVRETVPVPEPAPCRPAPAPEPRPEAAFVPPAPPEEDGEFVFDLEKELGKLKRIKEMLDRDAPPAAADPVFVPHRANAVPLPAEAAAPPEPEEIEWPVAPAASAEPGPDLKMPEIGQFIQDYVQREHGLAPGARAEESRPAAAEESDFQSVFSLLERYRRSEPTDYSGEISFFQNRDHLILDGESLLRAMTTVVAEARKLFGRLRQASTPKDQFFIKQELINNQEVLRKIILRSVRMCERESCRLPRYTEDVLNGGTLKDLLERLNMDNWSNPEDFEAFETAATHLKDAFHRRITPPARYLSSIVQELEG